ncbi:MAG: cytochrome c [Anaerolineae bacterium]|nr:cytochrome c [Gemmatimonadaceae bacterium]
MWKTNLRVLAVVLVVVGFYTMVAHIIPQLESEVPEALALGGNVTPEALAGAGEKVYMGAGGCTACHGLGTRAPNLLADHAGTGLIGARCGSRKPGTDCKTYLYESMTEPNKYVVPGFEPIMPDMRRQLADDQIWAVIAYLQSQGGEITVTGADVQAKAAPGDAVAAGAPGSPGAVGSAGAQAAQAAAGAKPGGTTDPRELLTQNGCVGCHQLEGKGAPIGPTFDGIGKRLTAEQIRKAILLPNEDVTKGYETVAGIMPTTFGQTLTAAQLELIVKFLAERK